VKRFQKRRQRAATPFGQPRLSSTLNIPTSPDPQGKCLIGFPLLAFERATELLPPC